MKTYYWMMILVLTCSVADAGKHGGLVKAFERKVRDVFDPTPEKVIRKVAPKVGPQFFAHGDRCGKQGDPKSKLVPEGWGPANFQDACTEHDACYEILGKSKSKCDREIQRNLSKECKRSFTGIYYPFLPECLAVAAGYAEVIRNSKDAEDSYKKSQREAKKKARAKK